MESPGSAEGHRQPMSKADYVYEVLRDEIRNARVPGGTQLKAAHLAERLGVSITPVREALRRLEKDRLVSYQSHRGATVIDLTDEALIEFYQVRAVIEGLGARLAATRITPQQLAQLRALHERMVTDAANGRLTGLGEQSRRLHLTIADIGGPAFLGRHAHAIRDSYPVPATASLWLDPQQANTHLAEHQRLLDALEAHDPDTAERVMIDHVRASGTYRAQGSG
ncbi:GntR family transcriptional regulator [Streptomyces millisiae]|uniref:GntR family transcriptional regulator n=1 Tax=Streptomyces millisiae TaxID=3075542 RepID=A0ABU2LJE4_9ACTN|nr:GntR family transcriptional regulator [Streptomyces sp. DSM 44918]MDT0317709.1 GntR family transcriptional regulator [Streptomyces sp. DSM 44918]